MELEATGPSIPAVILDEDGNMIDSRLPSGEPLQFVFEEIRWQQELSWEEAARRLEVAMYPFKKVRLGMREGRGRIYGAGQGLELWEQQVGTGRWAVCRACYLGFLPAGPRVPGEPPFAI